MNLLRLAEKVFIRGSHNSDKVFHSEISVCTKDVVPFFVFFSQSVNEFDRCWFDFFRANKAGIWLLAVMTFECLRFAGPLVVYCALSACFYFFWALLKVMHVLHALSALQRLKFWFSGYLHFVHSSVNVKVVV